MNKEQEQESLSRIESKLEQMSKEMYASGMVEYIEMVNNPRRFYWRNFVMGIARGFGMAIGFTIIAAVIIYVMRQVMALNIPLIGDFIAEITEIVINQLGTYR